jgi:Flp pilus assembly protein TadG
MDYRSYITYARASLGTHMARLRAALRDGDRGASAVELAFITAGLLVVAGVIYLAIHTFVKNESNSITSNTGPATDGGGGGAGGAGAP